MPRKRPFWKRFSRLWLLIAVLFACTVTLAIVYRERHHAWHVNTGGDTWSCIMLSGGNFTACYFSNGQPPLFGFRPPFSYMLGVGAFIGAHHQIEGEKQAWDDPAPEHVLDDWRQRKRTIRQAFSRFLSREIHNRTRYGLFGHFENSARTMSGSQRELIVSFPIWMAATPAFLLFAARGFRSRLRRRRRMKGLCMTCGYDIRGNAGDICPECGNVN